MGEKFDPNPGICDVSSFVDESTPPDTAGYCIAFVTEHYWPRTKFYWNGRHNLYKNELTNSDELLLYQALNEAPRLITLQEPYIIPPSFPHPIGNLLEHKHELQVLAGLI